MAIAATHRTSGGSTTNAASYTTASVASTLNDIMLIAVFNGVNPPNPAPTITSTHGDWALVASILVGFTTLSVHSTKANGNTGTITISFSGSQINCLWSVNEFSGANNDAPVVQSLSNYGTSASPAVTLVDFENIANATYGAVGVFSSATLTPGSGFAELGESGVFEVKNIETEFRNDNDTTVDWTASVSNDWQAIAIELREASVLAPALGFLAFM